MVENGHRWPGIHPQFASILGFPVLPKTEGNYGASLSCPVPVCVGVHTCARVHVCNNIMVRLRYSGSGMNDKSKFNGLGLHHFSQPLSLLAVSLLVSLSHTQTPIHTPLEKHGSSPSRK